LAGSDFAAQGYEAGYEAGDRFVALGYESTDTQGLSTPSDISDSVAIGYQSAPLYDGHFVLQNQSDGTAYDKPLIQGSFNTGNVGIGMANSTTTLPESRLQIQGSDTTSASSTLNVTDSAGSSLLYVRNDGNVGIGTESPDSLLHLDEGSSTSTMTVGSSGSPGCIKVRDSDDGGWSYITVKDGAINASTTSCE
jgi:hypothetical protein